MRFIQRNPKIQLHDDCYTCGFYTNGVVIELKEHVLSIDLLYLSSYIQYFLARYSYWYESKLEVASLMHWNGLILKTC